MYDVEYHKEYREKNREKIRAYRKAYHAKNKAETNAKSKIWYSNNKERQKDNSRAATIKRKYGLSMEQYSLLKKQGCYICGSHVRLCIDHCHVTNKVRGILCDDCNIGLGKFKDSIKTLQSAIRYLGELE